MHLGIHIPDMYPMVTLMTCIGVVTKLTVCEAPQRRGAGAEKAPKIQASFGTGHRILHVVPPEVLSQTGCRKFVPVESPGTVGSTLKTTGSQPCNFKTRSVWPVLTCPRSCRMRWLCHSPGGGC